MVQNGTVVLATESMDHVEELLGLGDGLAEVAKLIGERLQASIVLHDRKIALDERVVLGVDVHGARQLVVVEDRLDGRLKNGGGVLRLHDCIE